jgi:hypothetical protein
VVTLDAGYCSLSNASLMAAAGYSYVLALKENQPELLREAQRVLPPLAATQRPEAKVLDRDHSQWVRRSLWWRAACTGWLEVDASAAGLADGHGEVCPPDEPAGRQPARGGGGSLLHHHCTLASRGGGGRPWGGANTLGSGVRRQGCRAEAP